MTHIPSPKYVIFSQRLIEIRVKRGLSQVDLARLAGIQSPILCHFETGNRAPSFSNLLKIAKALSIDLDYLTGTSDNPSPGPILRTIFRNIDPRSLNQKFLNELGDYVQYLALRNRKSNKQA